MEDMKADRHQKIQGQIINFDRVLLECFFGNREKKYFDNYKNRIDDVEVEDGGDAMARINEESPRAKRPSRLCK